MSQNSDSNSRAGDAGAGMPAAGFDQALALAETEHATQTDKAGAPYILHVRRVIKGVQKIAPADLVQDCMIVAALHDVVEDCPVSLEDLAVLGFSQQVIDGVDSVTKREGEEYLDMVRRAGENPLGRWVKLADNLDNSSPERVAALTQYLENKYAGARAVLAEFGAVV
jgi:(p)ppGpp synthase/HD superfamily hydrolase